MVVDQLPDFTQCTEVAALAVSNEEMCLQNINSKIHTRIQLHCSICSVAERFYLPLTIFSRLLRVCSRIVSRFSFRKNALTMENGWMVGKLVESVHLAMIGASSVCLVQPQSKVLPSIPLSLLEIMHRKSPFKRPCYRRLVCTN